jgi:hypothetical protein
VGGVRASRLKFFALVCVAMLASSGANADAADTAPEVAPWTVPLYSGDPKQTHRAKPAPAAAGPVPDARELWTRALECWPIEKVIDATVSLEGRVRNVRGPELENQTRDSRAWVGIVARVPLYNGADVERERQREFQRRIKAAEAVGLLMTAITDVERVDRQAGLMRALERRAQERVRLGVADTSEQVAYLEKTAALESDRLKYDAAAQRARLELLALCAPGRVDQLDDFVRPFIEKRRRP